MVEQAKGTEETVARTLHPSHNLLTDDLVFIPLI